MKEEACAKGLSRKSEGERERERRERGKERGLTEDAFHRLPDVPGESGECSACVRLYNNERSSATTTANNNKQQEES